MKTKTLKKLATVVAASAIAACMVMPAMAATTYTPVAGTSCNFNKYLIMDAGDTVPNVTFSFTVAPGSARSADTSDNDVMQVLPGVGTPTIADVTFSSSDSTSTSTTGLIDINRTQEDRTGTEGEDTVQFDAGEKFATQQATVSFTGITFNEPGIYRYVITETANADHAAAGIIHDTDTDRILDVYVTDDGSGTLEVSSYVLHTEDEDVTIGTSMGSDDVDAEDDAVDDKTDGFTNEYVSKDLKFEKSVTGNQASRDKWFEFTATLANVNDADVYVVSLADDSDSNTNDGDADATSGTTAATRTSNQGKTNPTSVTGAQLKAGVKFYLQDGQSIVIRGIAPNATYTITEDAEDYSSAVMSGKTNSGTIGTVAGDAKVAEAGFTNTRDGIIPTGVFLKYGIPVAVIAAAVCAFVVYTIVRRKNDKDEEDI